MSDQHLSPAPQPQLSEPLEVPQKQPAVRVPLHGKHLIEASAGTGKTWTLTGIVLRLLIEAKRAPEHIIATTFTRAAAAEMRERIHARLVDFYQLLQWLNRLTEPTPNATIHRILYPQLTPNRTEPAPNETDIPNTSGTSIAHNKITPAQVDIRQQWLSEQARLSGYTDLFDDPINQHLLIYLLDHTHSYPLADAIRRTALVLTTLDKLFVGTLDSLSQKWLSEYSAETGYQQGMQISDHEQVVIESIIHDAVRGFLSHMYHQQPEIYALLQHTNKLPTPADHLSSAQKSLQFISVDIDKVDIGEDIDFVAYQQALADFVACDLKDVEPYFNKDYRKSQGFHGTASLGAKLDRIGTIQSAIEQYDTVFFMHLDEDTMKFYDALPHAFLSKEDGGKGFNGNKEAERHAFTTLKSIQALRTLHDHTQQIEGYLDSIINILNRNIALQVREKLPAILEARSETTFALQMVRLNQALSGKQGHRLARYIRHHYPVALIDESQDINGEQAQMLQRIYIHRDSHAANVDKMADNSDTRRGFLLLVGDPKQAIYGFRGGDVANYNAMKRHFNSKDIMTLTVNRRSNEPLINAMNHWFGRATPTDDNNNNNNSNSNNHASQSACTDALAQLGQDIYYQHITASKAETRLSWQSTEGQSSLSSPVAAILPNRPVSVLHLPYDKEAKYSDCELTALHIKALLASGQMLDGQPLQPSDIGVLGRTKKELKQVENQLTKLGVPTLETAEVNVFDTLIATDLIALLEAILRPHRRDMINRVLTSHLYQLSLHEVQALMLSIDSDEMAFVDKGAQAYDHSGHSLLKQRYQDFQGYLKTAALHWQQDGILAALHYALAHNPMAHNFVAHNSMSHNSMAQASDSSIWVALAKLPEGARYLMDLRHLLDILAQHGTHIGEHELLAWYKKNMNSRHTPDWAKQQPLPTESGVQLMTIHKSKGLEFPVVYVIGMDTASRQANDKKGGRNKHNLYLYNAAIAAEPNENNQQTQRRLSASEGKPSKSAKGESDTNYYAQFETTENYEERRRLAYVAFTRASEQLYIVLSDASKNENNNLKPMVQWLEGSDKSFVLPPRLQEYIGWLEYKTIETHAEAVISTYKMSPHKKSTETNTNTPINTTINTNTKIRINYDDAYEQIQQHSFKGWAKTSFTALSRQIGEQTQALAIFDDSVEDDFDLTDGLSLLSLTESQDKGADSMTADNIRFRFVKGANAGSFLHQVFEKIDFTTQTKWSSIIDQGLRQYQLPLSYTSAATQQRLQPAASTSTLALINNADNAATDLEESSLLAIAHNELLAWIADVLAAPLLASNQSLQSIPSKHRIAELSFNMGLSEEFLPEDINSVFSAHLPNEPNKHIQLTAHHSDYIYRYLRGEIDLVYEHAGKYYVVDYKSNYLGNSLSNYNHKNIEAAMSKAGYWLQAAIYQVALHRFLRLRLPHYSGNESQYLGAVEYVFLRGIDSQGANDYGRIQWQIPFALIDGLDKLFGNPSI